MIKAFKSLLSLGLVLFLLVIFSTEARADVETPKIIKLTAQKFLSLTGIAPANSEVLVYLDGNLVGQTEAAFNCSSPVAEEPACQPSWHFQYNPILRLTDGSHLIMAIAQDKTSLVLSAPTSEIKFTINAVPSPILIAPNEKTATADLKPLITGLTRDNSSVKIFIDGVYDGQTGLLRDDSGTANFAYRPASDLSRGFHKITALAEDSIGQASPESEIMNFKIELPLPAPTIFKPVINRQTSSSRPFIVGLVKNDCKVKIYIDRKYQGELLVKNHSSGTANFAYKPIVALTRGEHSVYTVAIDKRGKESAWSKTVNFSTKNSAIAESVREERKEAAVNINEPKEPAKIELPPVVISDGLGTVVEKPEEATAEKIIIPAPGESGTGLTGVNLESKAVQPELEDKGKAALEKVKNLIGVNQEVTKSDRGMINEGKQNQGRLKLSIILFILFLVGVVAWLLWVNRELVKERRSQNEAEEKSGINNDNPPDQGQQNKLL